jgi:hypothetical protein
MDGFRGAIGLLVAALVLQGLVAVVPHDHGAVCVGGPAFEAPGGLEAPHHCLACSAHAPTATVGAGVAVVWSERDAAPIVSMPPIRVFAATVESFGPRGPPRVV